MTRLVRAHLGTSPGYGTQALNQATAFKRQLRSLLVTPPGTSLLTVSDRGTVWVEAVYDAHTPGAEAWAERARSLSPDIWATMAERRKGRGW